MEMDQKGMMKYTLRGAWNPWKLGRGLQQTDPPSEPPREPAPPTCSSGTLAPRAVTQQISAVFSHQAVVTCYLQPLLECTFRGDRDFCLFVHQWVPSSLNGAPSETNDQ